MARRPDWICNVVVDDRWREIGVAFESEDGETLSVLLDALPTGGKIILRKPRERQDDSIARARAEK